MYDSPSERAIDNLLDNPEDDSEDQESSSIDDWGVQDVTARRVDQEKKKTKKGAN